MHIHTQSKLGDMVSEGNATALPLLWGSLEGAQAIGAPFDVIICSDVVYRLAARVCVCVCVCVFVYYM